MVAASTSTKPPDVHALPIVCVASAIAVGVPPCRQKLATLPAVLNSSPVTSLLSAFLRIRTWIDTPGDPALIPPKNLSAISEVPRERRVPAHREGGPRRSARSSR